MESIKYIGPGSFSFGGKLLIVNDEITIDKATAEKLVNSGSFKKTTKTKRAKT